MSPNLTRQLLEALALVGRIASAMLGSSADFSLTLAETVNEFLRGQFCSPTMIPRELQLVAQTGREENLELVTATQLPHKINASITGQSTEIVCFRLTEPLALNRVSELDADRAEVAALPLGSFVSYNRLSGGKLGGRVF